MNTCDASFIAVAILFQSFDNSSRVSGKTYPIAQNYTIVLTDRERMPSPGTCCTLEMGKRWGDPPAGRSAGYALPCDVGL
jgi:hypothetical protein